MLSYDEALALTLKEPKPLGVEQVRLEAGAGRVLAGDLTAPFDHPPAPTSAMDGYGVRDEDAAEGARLSVIGQSLPGAPFTGAVGTGQCVRLFTGAAVPDGCRVVVQEVVRREGDLAVIESQPNPMRHVRPLGSDFRRGDVLLATGARLTPQAMIAAACADEAKITVFLRPRVALIATGDELARPGTARATPNAIPESVSFGVAAMAEVWGGEIVHRASAIDDPAPLKAAARAALEAADLVVVTGGASVGDRDFAKAMFDDEGLALVFSKAAIKPGKPVWVGRAGGKLVLGLPGNPTSALVTARLFMAPLLVALSGGDPVEALAWRDMALAAPLPPSGDRETFVRAVLRDGRALPLTDQDSGAQRALALATLLIRRPAGAQAVPAGEPAQTLAL